MLTRPSAFDDSATSAIRSGVVVYLVRDAKLAPAHAVPLDLFIGVNAGVGEYFLVGEPSALQGALITLGIADHFSIRPVDHGDIPAAVAPVLEPIRTLAPPGWTGGIDVHAPDEEGYPEEPL